MSGLESSQENSDKDPLPFRFDGGDDPEPPVIGCIEYSPDGQSIATGARDSTVRLWDAKTGLQTRKLLAGHPVLWLSFSHSGRKLAAISSDSDAKRAHVVIWDVEQDKTELCKLETSYESDGTLVEGEYRVVFSPDDNLVAVMTPLCVVVQGATLGTLVVDVVKISGDDRLASLLGFSSDGRRLFYAYLKDKVEVRSFDMELRQQLSINLSLPYPSLSFLYRLPYTCSPDGRTIAGPTPQGGFQVHDTETGEAMQAALRGHLENTSSICFSQDGEWVVDGSEAGTICIWDVSTGKKVMGPLKASHRSRQAVTAITCSPSKERVACITANREVHVWDLHTQKITLSSVPMEKDGPLTPLRISSYSASVSDMHVFPDGRHLVSSALNDDQIRIWDLQTGNQVRELSFPGGCHVALSVDGSLLAVGSTKPFGCVILLDAHSGQEYTPPLMGAGSQTEKLAFSPDSSAVAVLLGDMTLWLVHDVLGDRKTSKIEDSVMDVAFSPDGTHFAHVSLTGMITLCNVGTTEVITRLPGELAHNLAFLPDGKTLLQTNQNKVLFWDVTTGQKVFQHMLSFQPRARIAASPDGKAFVCGRGTSADEYGLEMVDVVKGKQLWSITNLIRNHTAIAFSPTGDKVVVGFIGGTLQVFEASTGRRLIPSVDDRSSIELEMTSVQKRSQRVRSGLADWDDDSIMNMPATSSRAARRDMQGLNRGINDQQMHRGTQKITDGGRGSGLIARLSSRISNSLSPGQAAEPRNQRRLPHIFQLVGLGRAKNRVLTAGEQGNRYREDRRVQHEDDSFSPSPPESDRAHSPITRTGESESSMSSSNWFTDYVCYC
ncbi:WD40 repeat-like protein [Coniophora puteana RWD-64-598 SS2]|uniref:WD40 repeat-like protein n=1 Tax=Coniophora puteana (strain RWD-64-598) TaxID=741705 RepID=A0A5M3MBV2_CONPW|nr:WD40 repeat-like protein [Coniophora puteana RWD-64-598 SS2]EIW76300.1 WD40 repeat-like protein [Coniophora puteana RWD-64-598 SS2]